MKLVKIITDDGEVVTVPADHLRGAQEYRKWEKLSREATNLEGGDIPPKTVRIKTDWQPGEKVKIGEMTGKIVARRDDGRYDVAWSNGVTTPARAEKFASAKRVKR